MREAAAFALLACACGVVARTKPARSPARATALEEPAPAAVDASGDGGDRFGAIEARWSRAAPGMRVMARREGAGGRVEIFRAEPQDACVRVAFEATAPVLARLVDSSGAVLASCATAATEGVLAEQGPVCIRRGDVLSGVADGPAAVRVRWVAWSGL